MGTEPTSRADNRRRIAAAVLLCAAPVLPWNLYFGVGVPGSRPVLFAAAAVATLLSLGSIAVDRAAPDSALTGRLRLGLNAPYLLLVAGFVLFDVVQTVRYTGTTWVPGGVGPGAWFAAAGALLAARPAIPDPPATGRWSAAIRILGYLSIVGAGLSTLLNLYWRSGYALTSVDATGGFGRQQIAILATVLVYGAAAWVGVFIASRWLLRSDPASQLATVTLGASTLLAGALIWLVPGGRYIDEFHAIAQNTSTAGVGFEGYLLWSAAAAIWASSALTGRATQRLRDGGAWSAALRKMLTLIAVWCAASAVMRSVDIFASVLLDLPYSPYDSAAMAAFDVITAVIAVWLGLNMGNRALPPMVLWAICAALAGFSIARIVVGVGLAPRLDEAQRAAALAAPVYGNGLAQQITGTFDVVLCGLAACALLVMIAVPGVSRPAPGPPPPTPEPPTSEPPHPSPPPATEPQRPRIHRPAHAARPLLGGSPKISRKSADSTRSGRREG